MPSALRSLPATMLEVSCPLCGSGRWSLYVWAPSHYGPERRRVTRCRDCGMIYTNPQPATYVNEVTQRGVLGRHFLTGVIDKGRRTAKLQLKIVSRFVEGRRLLDFGCGNGVTVKEALDQGWDAMGVDLNVGLVDAANRHWRIDALCSTPLKALVHHRTAWFDAILCNQVMEHIQDPVATGAMLCALLRPRGVLFIDVPNARQLTEWFHRGSTLDPTSQWNHFTTETLRGLVQRLGCTVVYASAAPSLIDVYQRFARPGLSLALARTSKRVLPPVGSGVCVIGQKPRSLEMSAACAH